MLCKIGIHRWLKKPTARPGTTVSRCTRCNAVRVKHDRPTWRR